MLETIRRYGFTDETVLAAMARVPRHKFVPERQQAHAYEDSPLPIGYGQTISQPYIVAEMTRQLELTADSRVLEVGTGSGYQAAVLAEITDHVFTVEIIKELALSAESTLKANGYGAVQVRHADGYFGWEEEAPYDAIIVTCAAGQIPPSLIKQLKAGGRMVIPIGKRFGTQVLILATKNMDGTIASRTLMMVRFVPLTRL
jgi:protein-L-isoaspartate(D-aspartate) O-methyltransferase